MVTKEQRKEIENACSTLYVGNDYKSLYLHLNSILRNYSAMMAEHDSQFGEVITEEASQDIFTLSSLIGVIEKLVADDLDSIKD